MLTVLGDPYTLDDALGTLGAIGPWWAQLLDGRDPGAAATTVDALLDEQEAALRELLARLGEADTAAATPGRLEVLDALGGRARGRLAAAHRDGASLAAAEDALGRSLTALRAGADALRAAGALPGTASGTVVQVSASGGGVPKRAVDQGDIGARGLLGDAQGTRKHHGRPWQALCLWSAEVIDAFAADGHPIGYGACGENLTLGGLDWGQVRSGVRLRVGTALVEATVFTLPCSHNARWFADGDFNRMHHARGPVSRVYARVVRPGQVRPGDDAVLEPA